MFDFSLFRYCDLISFQKFSKPLLDNRLICLIFVTVSSTLFEGKYCQNFLQLFLDYPCVFEEALSKPKAQVKVEMRDRQLGRAKCEKTLIKPIR